MSVLKGEGRVPILFGTSSVPAGPVTRTAYLARPDLAGEWPTVLVVPSVWGLTSSAKDVSRRLARQGLAVLAADLYGGRPPSRRAPVADATAAHDGLDRSEIDSTLADLAAFVTNPSGFWSSAERGFGVLGFGAGGLHAMRAVAAGIGESLAIVGSPPGEPDGEGGIITPVITGPLLALYGRNDERVPIDHVMELRAAAPHGEFVLYDGVGGEFMDDHSDEYDAWAAADTIDRLTGFFEKTLPAPPE